MKKLLVLFGLSVVSVLAQTTTGDDLITVPKKYVSNEGIQHTQTQESIGKVSNWVGFGKELGEGTKEALNSIADTSDKFSKTDLGHFILIMVAWHIIGHQLLGIVLGIPIWLFGLWIWFYLFKKLFMKTRVLTKNEKGAKEWAILEPYKFYSTESRGTAGAFLGGGLIIWNIILLSVIFWG